MANMMMTLMDNFNDEGRSARSRGDFHAASIYGTCESIANNCHGKGDIEVLDFVMTALESNRARAELSERDIWDNALAIVKSHVRY